MIIAYLTEEKNAHRGEDSWQDSIDWKDLRQSGVEYVSVDDVLYSYNKYGLIEAVSC